VKESTHLFYSTRWNNRIDKETLLLPSLVVLGNFLSVLMKLLYRERSSTTTDKCTIGEINE
jgi:hypothetical protein